MYECAVAFDNMLVSETLRYQLTPSFPDDCGYDLLHFIIITE